MFKNTLAYKSDVYNQGRLKGSTVSFFILLVYLTYFNVRSGQVSHVLYVVLLYNLLSINWPKQQLVGLFIYFLWQLFIYLLYILYLMCF